MFFFSTMHTHIAYKISHDTITITVESDSPKPSSERVYQLAGKIFDKQFQERPTYRHP